MNRLAKFGDTPSALREPDSSNQLAQDPLKRLHDLRGAFSRELTELAERFETEIETYRKIQSAIETKKEELNTIYEVETAASDLAALIDAQRVKKERFERQMQDQKEAFEAEMEEIRTQWQRERTDRERRVKEQAEAIDKQRPLFIAAEVGRTPERLEARLSRPFLDLKKQRAAGFLVVAHDFEEAKEGGLFVVGLIM